jgi:hypothetical protein
MKPPYSEVIATNMDQGKHKWRIPIGDADESVKNHPALKGLGLDFSKMGKFDVRPGPLLTKELLFLGESGNIGGRLGRSDVPRLRQARRKGVWEGEMPNARDRRADDLR